jgi:class 3 adenylate cyclase/tetratricopeptide (TPR) repeat protein
MRVCPTCGEENSDRARFCQACATPLDDQPAAREVRKVVTIVFSDVTGSTALGERLDPESLRRVMARYFDAMARVIQAHGGVVEKFIGDAVMAVFGIPRLHEDDALRAVRAAVGMRDALADLNERLGAELGVTIATRIGVNTGEVVTGDPSAGQRLVTGDAVNTAARLEQSAAPGEVLIGERTQRLVRDAVRVEPVEPLQVKGKADPLPAYRLLAVEPGADSHTRRLDSPLVGRRREQDLLRQALDRAMSERTCHLFTLLGPAGVGKSRLVQEFVAGAAPTARILGGRCLSYGEGITFRPVGEVVRRAAGIEDADPPDTARRKLERLLSGADDGSLVAARVAELIGLAELPSGGEDSFWAVRRLLESLARDRPLAVVFDDVHWAEPTFLDLVDHVADWTRDAPILLLCLARPELLEIRPGWGGGKLNATSILLEPLGASECELLIENLLGSADIPPAARVRILAAAEGNPLFVEEMLAMLIDDGLLRRENGRWVGTEDLARVAVPPTIQLLLAARLDRLDAEERAVMERGAVEGKVFHVGAVASLSPPDLRIRVVPRLLGLTRKELIRPDRGEFAGEDAFRFRHLLIRDAAYQGMPKEVRAALHEAFADWLVAAAHARMAEYDDILGHHLEQAYRYRAELGPVDEGSARLASRAADHLSKAGSRALHRGDGPAARTLLSRAVELLPEGSGARLRLLPDLADALIDTGALGEADGLLRLAIEQAGRAGDRLVAANAIVRRAYVRTSVDPGYYSTKDARDDAADVIPTLEELGDERGLVLARGTLAFFDFVLGQVEHSVRMARAMLDTARRLGLRRETARALAWFTGGLYFGPTPVAEAIETCLQLEREFHDDRPAVAASIRTLPALLGMQGRFDEGRAMAERVRGLFEELGDRFRLAARAFWTGPLEMLAGRPDLAEQELRRSFDQLERLGDKGFRSTIAGYLANATYAQGRDEETARWAAVCRDLAGHDDIVSQVQWRSTSAKAAARGGDGDAGVRVVLDALDLASRMDYVNLRAETHMDAAEVFRLTGQPDRAVDQAREALRLFTSKGNEVSAAVALDVLAELAGEPTG